MQPALLIPAWEGPPAPWSVLAETFPDWAFPPVDPAHPVHPEAKPTCSLLLRHLSPLTGLTALPQTSREVQQLPHAVRSATALLTGVDALRRRKHAGAFLERPEALVRIGGEAVLAAWLSDLHQRKGFGIAVHTASPRLFEALQGAHPAIKILSRANFPDPYALQRGQTGQGN